MRFTSGIDCRDIRRVDGFLTNPAMLRIAAADCYFSRMSSTGVVLLLIAILALWRAPAQSQTSAPNPAPAPNQVQLEAKPPDEPSSASSPDTEALPDATSSASALPPPAESDEDSGTPIAANAIAHPPEIHRRHARKKSRAASY
jgi:hypothetical protein